MNTETKTILTLESVLKQVPVEKAQTREEKEQAANELAKRLAEKGIFRHVRRQERPWFLAVPRRHGVGKTAVGSF